MLDLTTQYNYTSTGDGGGGFITSGYTGYRVVNNNEYCEVLLNIDGVSQLSRMSFYGLSVTDSNQFVQQAVDNIGRYGETHQDWTNMTAYRVIPAQILTETNGGPLLTLANAYKDKYFGGITQTASSLKAYLDRMYGVHNGYAYVQFSGGDFIITTRLGDITSINAPINYVSDWAGGTIAPAEYLSITGDMYTLPSDVSTLADVEAALIFGERVTPNKLQFDVYIDGAKDPNVTIKWKALEINDDFSLQLVTPIVWTDPGAPPAFPLTDIVLNHGINIPDESKTWMRKYVNTFAGQYANPYLTEFNAVAQEYSTFERITLFGIDGIANAMSYLMRFNMQINEGGHGLMTWGSLFRVTIPREPTIENVEVIEINDSAYEKNFLTYVEVHMQAPPDEIPDDSDDYPDGQDYDGDPGGAYDPDTVIPDFGDYETDGFTGKAVLTKSYALTAAGLQNVGSKLWSQSYLDVFKIQNNPIDNIVSVKWFPFALSGSSQEIKVGNILFGYNGDVVDTLYKFDVGSCKVQPKYNSFLDMSPYTTIKLHLPYCGILQLDATEVYKRTIRVRYVVDLVSGDCMAFVYLDNEPYMNVAGAMGVDIPITSSNRIQSEMRAASSAISAVVGAGAHVMAGDVVGGAAQAATGALNIAGMDFNSQRTSSHSPACTSTENRAVFLEIFRPAIDASLFNTGYKSRHGWPCHKFVTLSELKLEGRPAFVRCDARTKIDFAMTRRENEMLEELLTSGVYV